MVEAAGIASAVQTLGGADQSEVGSEDAQRPSDASGTGALTTVGILLGDEAAQDDLSSFLDTSAGAKETAGEEAGTSGSRAEGDRQRTPGVVQAGLVEARVNTGEDTTTKSARQKLSRAVGSSPDDDADPQAVVEEARERTLSAISM